MDADEHGKTRIILENNKNPGKSVLIRFLIKTAGWLEELQTVFYFPGQPDHMRTVILQFLPVEISVNMFDFKSRSFD